MLIAISSQSNKDGRFTIKESLDVNDMKIYVFDATHREQATSIVHLDLQFSQNFFDLLWCIYGTFICGIFMAIMSVHPQKLEQNQINSFSKIITSVRVDKRGN